MPNDHRRENILSLQELRELFGEIMEAIAELRLNYCISPEQGAAGWRTGRSLSLFWRERVYDNRLTSTFQIKGAFLRECNIPAAGLVSCFTDQDLSLGGLGG